MSALYRRVVVIPSTSGYGRWLVATSDTTQSYFWTRAQATAFAALHNMTMTALYGGQS